MQHMRIFDLRKLHDPLSPCLKLLWTTSVGQMHVLGVGLLLCWPPVDWPICYALCCTVLDLLSKLFQKEGLPSRVWCGADEQGATDTSSAMPGRLGSSLLPPTGAFCSLPASAT